jgi:hypothetical protein
MGYTGWLMPDGEFFPCEHKEHSETLRDLLETPQYRGLMADNIERGKPYNSEPEGCMCFWDTDFKFASFIGEMTEPVKEFLIKHFSEFNKEQKKCIYDKFYLLSLKTEGQEMILKEFEQFM